MKQPSNNSNCDNGEEANPGKLQKFITDDKTIDILKKKGVKSLFPVQYRTFDILYEGKDLMVRDKTGSGKTLAFALPIIQRLRKVRAFEKNHLAKFLIVLPTRELALQVKDQIQSLRFRDEPDFRVVAVYGKSDMQQQIRTIERGIDIIVATPGRLIDLLEKGVIKMNELQVLCLDEADEMLKQGFKEDLEKIYKYITDNAPKKTQNLLFSATIPDWLKDISRTYQDEDCEYINLLKDEQLLTPPTLSHMCLRLDRADQAFKPKVINNLLKKYAIKSGNSIIFCERKSDVQRMASSLSDCYNLRSESLHSDIPQSKREKAYRNFKSGELKTIIATNVAARGLDFPQIDIVIQTEPPNGVEPYIHRSGRTARKGREGICVTLYNDNTQRLIRNIERQAKITMIRLQARDFLTSSKDGQRQNRNERPYRNIDSVDRSTSNYDDEEYEIYAKYFPSEKSQSQIMDFFRDKNITVKTIKLMKTSSGESKGCGFLKFTSRKERDECLKLDGERFEDNHISLSLPSKR